ncbi:MAG TPA: hypothetical protein VER03_24035 [Bryobacteraceae bacterium]|nr:hypothetical protein [Bryobacteraceae bacterium]
MANCPAASGIVEYGGLLPIIGISMRFARFSGFSGSRAYHRPFNAAGRLRLLGLTGRSRTSGHRWMRERKSRSKGAAAFTSTRATGDLSVCGGKRQQRDKQ